MLNWLYKQSSLYKQQQLENAVMRSDMLQVIQDFKDEQKWAKRFNVFADNINHILTGRTNGTAMYFVPEITFILVTTRIMRQKADFYVYAPFESITEIASAYTSLAGNGKMVIEEFWVQEELQRKGIGASLLKEIVFRAQQMELNSLAVNTGTEGSKQEQCCTAFYKKNGFTAQEQKDDKEQVLTLAPHAA